MKKITYIAIACFLFILEACETTQEITVNENGGGQFTSITDLGNAITVAKQFNPRHLPMPVNLKWIQLYRLRPLSIVCPALMQMKKPW